MKNSVDKNIYSWIIVFLSLAQISIILVSWIISAVVPSGNYHSLLSSEGVRWYLGQFLANMSNPLLIILVLACMMNGVIIKSGILHFDKRKYRNRIAMNFSLAELLLVVIVMILLTLMPHAIMLSITGNLFPSSFSSSIIPVTAFTLILISESYALLSGNFHGLSDVIFSLTSGIQKGAPLFLLYIIGCQFFYSLLFVFAK